jgi:hypothetical protein
MGEGMSGGKINIEIQIWSNRYDEREKRDVPNECLESKSVLSKTDGDFLKCVIPPELQAPAGKFWIVFKKDGILFAVGDGSPFKTATPKIINVIAIQQIKEA